ncbi:hypothetical protein TNCV_2436151 [Trichonephila clavipes]|nr:hypothetical protein TNCV_2436151 [Trichonephila clavipes]
MDVLEQGGNSRSVSDIRNLNHNSAELRSTTPVKLGSSLQAPEGWYQGQSCVEPLCESIIHLRPALGGNVCIGHANMSTGRGISEGLLSLPMSPGLVLKEIVGVVHLEKTWNSFSSITYPDGILDAYMRPYSGATGDAFELQVDNVKPYRARMVDAYLENEAIQRML